MDQISFVIVDDTLFMRNLLRKMIESVPNYQILGEGKNGFEAVNKARIFKPDVMTLDITMPGLDGISAVEQILKESPLTKIIICSALGNEQSIREAIRRGASDFVLKPFEQERLLSSIRRLTEVHVH